MNLFVGQWIWQLRKNGLLCKTKTMNDFLSLWHMCIFVATLPRKDQTTGNEGKQTDSDKATWLSLICK